MAINERLVHTASAAAGAGNAGEEGLILHLDANDVDSYDGDGTEWVDIKDHEYTPATNVSEHFNTVIWNGDGASTRSITNVGFQPDFIWVKARQAQNHTIYDSLRGTGKYLAADGPAVETTSTTYGQLTSFDSYGFTGSEGSNQTYSFFNSSSQTYVAWCFKAGGAPSGSDKVSIDGTSYSTMTAANLTDGTEPISKLSINTKLGFSIVKYTAPALRVDTVAHGLGQTPEMIILKSTSVSRSWNVFHKDIGTSNNLHLNFDHPANTDEDWTVNSTTFSIQDYSASADWVAYCFASKRGVSKVGSYTGTGAAGNKIYTGFEPAFLMVKSAGSGEWNIWDNVRDTDSSKDTTLWANSNTTEAVASQGGIYNVSFDRDGFTQNNAYNPMNGNGFKYIYYAVAKNTNETSLIPDTDLELHLDADSFPEKGEAGYSNTPTTWTDSSSNSNNGTITGATFDSELGNYLDFDGINDTAQIGSSMYKSLPMTVEAWVNPLLTDNSVIYSNYDSSAIKGFYIRVNTSGQIFVDAYSNPSGTYQRTVAYSSEYLTANKWSHVAVTFSTSNVTVYVNGESSTPVTTNTNGITFTPSFSTLIGARAGTSDEFYGKIGQVRAYSTELSLVQIRQNYNFTKNDYPNGYNGIISGATWNSGGYFDFDGSGDSVNLGSDLSFNIGSTISLWINADTLGGNRGIMSKWAGSAPNGWIINHQGNGNIEFFFYSGSSFKKVDLGIAAISSWHHVAITYDGNDLKGYLNGNLADTESNINFLVPNDNATNVLLYTPAISGITTQQYDGKISKVKMYDKALTSTEITALHSEGE